MHTIHHCKAFILKSADSGEANKMLWLFTKEYGLVITKVQGIRKEGSKLRAHLVDYTLIDVDLVRGRDVWRLISAKVDTNPFIVGYNNNRTRSYVRALSLVSRFCIEEGEESEIFQHLQNILTTINVPVDNDSDKIFDAIILWKILVMLGYIEIKEEMIKIFNTELGEIKNQNNIILKKIIKEVTEAINRSHL